MIANFGSRTGRPPDNDNNINVFIEHCNVDGVITKYGRSLVFFCLNTELKYNGRLFDHRCIGRYTYYSPMGASSIDFVILRNDYMINKFKALPEFVESDHCPIQFHILNVKLKEIISSKEMNLHINDSSPCSKVVYGKMERSNNKHLYEMSRYVLRLRQCYVL